MRIECQGHYEKTVKYAESIGDETLNKCIERLKQWEANSLSLIHISEFPEDSGAFQQPAHYKSICRHIPCPIVFGNKRRKESKDDMARCV